MKNLTTKTGQKVLDSFLKRNPIYLQDNKLWKKFQSIFNKEKHHLNFGVCLKEIFEVVDKKVKRLKNK